MTMLTAFVYPLLGGPLPFGEKAELTCEIGPAHGHEKRRTYQSKVAVSVWASVYTADRHENEMVKESLTRSMQDIMRQIVADKKELDRLADSSRRASAQAAAPVLVTPAFAADTKLVAGYGTTAAVLSFDARGGVSADEAALMSDRFAIELDKMNVYKLVNRSKMNEILKLQNFSRQSNCNATECAIEAGQLLGTKLMIYGSIGKVGKLYTLNTYIVNVENGSTVASATTDITGGIEDMLTQGMNGNVQSLLGSAVKPQPLR
jgi:hypothetical protein